MFIMTKVRFILDSDIGSDIDDAMALLLCLRIRDFPLVAITTVYFRVELRARIARKMLTLDGVDIPVGIGISKPIDKLGFLWATGKEGEGLLSKEDFEVPLSELGVIKDGIELMYNTVQRYSKKIEIISIGQFTNIAKAIKRYPNFSSFVSRIWSMSAGVTFPGAIPEKFPDPSNSYEAIPSHNIRCDPKAAKIVLKSGIPITFVGNDVTTKVFFNEVDINKVKSQGSALNRAVMNMMKVWLDYRSKIFHRKIDQTCLHDALVVAEANRMEFTKKIPIDIKIFEDGSTNVRLNEESNYEICWSVNSEDFLNWYLETACKSNF